MTKGQKDDPTGDPQNSRPRRPRGKVTRGIALAALAEGKTNVEAAALAQVDESTIRAWRRDPLFIAELEPMIEATLQEARRELRGSSLLIVSNSIQIATGRKAGSPQEVAMARDLLNRLEIGSGERVEVDGDMDLKGLSLDELRALAAGKAA